MGLSLNLSKCEAYVAGASSTPFVDELQSDGSGLSCRLSGGCIPWYAVVNETIHCAQVSGGVPAVLELVGVCCDDGKRLDGMSLIHQWWGLPLLWDFTCSDTLAPSNLSISASGASQLANSAESAKIRKCFSLTPSSYFSLCVLRVWVLGDHVHIHWCDR